MLGPWLPWVPMVKNVFLVDCCVPLGSSWLWAQPIIPGTILGSNSPQFSWVMPDLVGNDNVMILSLRDKMGLPLISQKRCDIQQHFSFCHVWVKWQRCVVQPCHATTNLTYLFIIIAIFVMQSIANFTFYQFLQIKSSFPIFRSRTQKCNPFYWFPCQKNVRKFFITKDLQRKSKKKHCKWIGLNPPWFISDCGKFSFFHFQSNLCA